AHRLHRLDRAERRVGGELRALLRKLEVDDVAELALRVVGDADREHAGVGGRLHVLVVGRVAEVSGDGRHFRDAGCGGGMRESEKTVRGAEMEYGRRKELRVPGET